MSNTMIQNPVAQVAAAMNRPVMLKDVAEKLGMSLACVKSCMGKKTTMSQAKIDLVRNTAREMGYDVSLSKSWSGKRAASFLKPASQKQCTKCGVLYVPNRVSQLYCPECRVIMNREHVAKAYRKHHQNWQGGNFKTREEEIARMQELRAQGYSNAEIAKAIGRCPDTVRENIGKQDIELSLQNRAMGAHIRAQKNAARKAYVVNKPIREYNKRVEQHNKMKAELALLQVDLLTQKPIIEQAAQTKIDFPLIDLHTVQPTALQ